LAHAQTPAPTHRISPQIEHRLFSRISMNWRARPLVSHEVILELITATQTRSGLKVRAALDRGHYPLGVKISDRELAAVPLRRHGWHGEWNTRCCPPPHSRTGNQACRAGTP
jgi:Rhodopirellula transposase DDE domain